jgi:uncharacterized membrane protein
MNTALWIAQIVSGIYFIGVGILHFIVPEGLPAMMAWMYDLSPALHTLSGTAEILGGLGLILPAVTRIRTELVPLAAAGLALVMVGAIVFHVSRGEYPQIGSNVLWLVVNAFIAWGRRTHPIAPRSAASAP